MTDSKTYAVRVLLRAGRDYDEALIRIAETEGEDAARRWDAAYIMALRSLAMYPRRYAVPPDAGGFPGEVRSVTFRRDLGTAPYRLIYRVIEDSDDGPQVEVMHLRHAQAKPITRKEAREIEAQNRE